MNKTDTLVLEKWNLLFPEVKHSFIYRPELGGGTGQYATKKKLGGRRPLGGGGTN